MPKLEKQYVHFMWDDELEGKEGFYADNIAILMDHVERNFDKGLVSPSGDRGWPFECCGDAWQLFYYDPYYELKLAHGQGKVIQYINGYGDWNGRVL